MKREKPKFDSDEDLAQVVTGHGPCTYLLLSLLGLILIFTYAKGEFLGRALPAILYSLVLIGGAYAISWNSRRLIIGSGLALLGITLQWTALLTDIGVIYRLASNLLCCDSHPYDRRGVSIHPEERPGYGR